MRATECIIAVPGASTYDALERKYVIKKYNQMSGPDFERQFTTNEDIAFEENEIAVTDGPLKDKRIIRKVAPFTRVDSWHDRLVNASIGSLIYTEPDGFPIGEYVAVSDPLQSNIANNMYNFYKIYGWYANKFSNTEGLLPEVKSGTQPLLKVEKSIVNEISRMLSRKF